MRGDNPYSAEVNSYLKNTWLVVTKYHIVVAPVCAYPLPAYILTSPFGMLPMDVAVVVWFGLAYLVPFALIFATGLSTLSAVMLTALFTPLWYAAFIRTSSVLWLLFVLCLIGCTERGRYRAASVLIPIVALKPQIGLLFGLFAAGKILRAGHWRELLLWSAASSCTLLAISFAFVPDWLMGWQNSLALYGQQAASFPLLPLPLLIVTLLLLLYFREWLGTWGSVAIVSVCIMPIHAYYSLLPLILSWGALRTKLKYLLLASGYVTPIVLGDSYNLGSTFIFAGVFPLLLALCSEVIQSRLFESDTTTVNNSASDT